MEEDASELELTFQYKDEIRNKYINLKPQGHKLKVTKYIFFKLVKTKINTFICWQTTKSTNSCGSKVETSSRVSKNLSINNGFKCLTMKS